MAKPIIFDGETHREMNAAEYAQWQKDVEENQAQLEAAADMAKARENALAKLEALGLTPAEVAALVGA